MVKVKLVFIDGFLFYWDEDRVRKYFKDYGEIERIILVRNMSIVKRKDFGFVDFIIYEVVVVCIEDLKSKELVDGNSKVFFLFCIFLIFKLIISNKEEYNKILSGFVGVIKV